MVAVATANVECLLCGADQNRHIGNKVHRGRVVREIELRSCIQCGLAFLKAQPQGFEQLLYDYYAKRVGQPMEALYDPITDARYEVLLRRLGTLAPGRRILDVGCGQGQFVHAARRLGWEARGIDLSVPAIQICESFGVPAQVLDFFSDELEPNSLDLITQFELIEHVPNPVDFLVRATELLVPGGLLYVTTPNFAALDRRVLGMKWEPIHVEHLTYFTPDTLRHAVRLASPELEELELQTRNVSAATLRTLASPKKLLAGRREAEATVGARGNAPAASRADQQKLRQTLEASRLLSAAKSTVNALLNRTDLGSAMTLLLRRRR